jgi:hypothetical protein
LLYSPVLIIDREDIYGTLEDRFPSIKREYEKVTSAPGIYQLTDVP